MDELYVLSEKLPALSLRQNQPELAQILDI